MAELSDAVAPADDKHPTMVEGHNVTCVIKSEHDDDSTNIVRVNHEYDSDNNLLVTIPEPKQDSPFQNIQIVIKKELPETDSVDITIHNIEVKKECDVYTGLQNNIQGTLFTNGYDYDQNITKTEYNNDPQEVTALTADENVSYDAPNFDNSDMHSDEGDDTMQVLGHLETCLQEDVDIKSEHDTEPHFQENIKEEFVPPDIKLESGLTVTDTHLLPTSLNEPPDGKDSKKLLVMKIGKNKNGLPKVILNSNGIQEQYENDYDPYLAEGYNYNEAAPMDSDFQLNSITGNMLTLEQQAFGVEESHPLACHLCPKRFKFQSAHDRHIKLHETLEKNQLSIRNGIPKRIKTCAKKKKLKEQKMARDYAEYLAGLSRPPARSESYKCTCGKVFQRRTRMEACLRAHSYCEPTCKAAPCVSCLICKNQFKGKHELEMHRKKMHRKKFLCKFCPTEYETKNELLKHLQIHQKLQLLEYKVISKVVQEKQVLRCVLCAQSCTDLSELKTHVMRSHKAPYNCAHCKDTFPNIVDFIDHTKRYHPDVKDLLVLKVLRAFSSLIQAWKCDECKQQFVQPDELAMHQIKEHSPDVNADAQFQCEHCRRVFASQKALTSHKRFHHKSDSTEETSQQIDGIMCLECRKMCKDMTALTSHMRLHSPDRKFPCKFCDFRFATKEKRKAHAEIHTGDMKYVCFICEYQCSSERRLKCHKKTPKHYSMQEYLLTGKPLLPDSTSKQENSESSKKKAKKKSLENTDKTESPKKRKSREKGMKDKESSSSSEDDNNSDADDTAACSICGEEFSSRERMELHKQDHPFIEILADGQDKPERIFFK